MIAHITVNGTPLCQINQSVVNCREGFKYASCGHANLAFAQEAVELLIKLNPNRDPADFKAVEGGCPVAYDPATEWVRWDE